MSSVSTSDWVLGFQQIGDYFSLKVNLIEGQLSMLFILAFLTTSYDTGSRFSREYPAEVGALKREFANVRGSAKLWMVSQGKVGPPNRAQFAMGLECDKFAFINTKVQSVEVVSCRNQARYFQLEKRGEKAGYAITALGDDPASRSSFDAVFGKYLHAAWATLNQDVLNQTALSQFHIVSEREFNESGRDLVEVVFQNGDPAKSLASFRITFDPALHWAIVRSEASLGGRTMEQFKITYDRFASGRIFMKTVHLLDVSHRELVCEFDPTDFAPIPEQEFTLEHYGLKDPARKRQVSSTPLILGGLLLASIGLLIIGRWLYRRSVRMA